MQIKAGFKKEWFQFSRTFRLWGILIATVSFSLADPLMYWAMNALLGSLTDTDMYGSIGGAVDIENSLGMLFGNAGSVFAGTMADLCATSLLIIMLILMSPCGGEQKKRATIIPSCSGLDTFSYLIPKYVMYPGTVFVTRIPGGADFRRSLQPAVHGRKSQRRNGAAGGVPVCGVHGVLYGGIHVDRAFHQQTRRCYGVYVRRRVYSADDTDVA